MSDLYTSIKLIEDEETRGQLKPSHLSKKRSLNTDLSQDMEDLSSNSFNESNSNNSPLGNYICNLENCGKSYSQRYRLLIHQRTHVSIYLI